MKRQWLYAGVAFASVAEFMFEGLWNEVVFPNFSADVQPLLRTTPDLTFNFLGATAFAFAFGLLYLHVPDARRGVRSGAILGTILGLLIGLYQFLDWYGSFNVSAMFVVLEVIETTLLGTICGVVISFVERRTRSAQDSAPKSPTP